MTSTFTDSSPTDGAMTRGSVVGRSVVGFAAGGAVGTGRSVLREVARVCAGWGVNEIHDWSMAERRGVLADVDRLIAVLGLAKARILSVEEASGDWALSGAKDVASWRAQSTRAGFGAAKGDLELATAVGELPRLGDAVADGSITLEHAKAVAREFGGASDAQKQVLLHDRDVQDKVFKNAERADAGKFGKSMKLTMAEIDPDKFQRDHDAVHERRFARVRYQAGGVYLEAFLNTFDGRKLSEALRATAHRPGVDDDRSRDQRGADALVAMVDTILAYGPRRAVQGGAASATGETQAILAGRAEQATPGAPIAQPTPAEGTAQTAPRIGTAPSASEGGTVESGSGIESPRGGDAVPVSEPPILPGANRPQLIITMSATELTQWRARGEFPGAVFDDDTPVPPTQLDALFCDTSIMRLVLDATSRPMHAGQNQRTFTGTARNILIARDRGCAWPGCGLPAWCAEGHHVTWWSHGGKTTTDNGILLCSRHHHMIHEGKMTIIPVEGGFRFDKPDGTVHGVHTFRPTRTGPPPKPPTASASVSMSEPALGPPPETWIGSPPRIRRG